MKRELAQKLLEKFEREGSGKLPGELKISGLGDGSFAVEDSQGETVVTDRETAEKRIAAYPESTVSDGEWRFGKYDRPLRKSFQVDVSWRRKEDARRRAAGVLVPGVYTYTIWAHPWDAPPRPMRTIVGTRADGYVALLIEQKKFDDEPEMSLRKGDPKETIAKRPMVSINPGGFRSIDQEFLKSSKLWGEYMDLLREKAKS